MHVVDIDSVPVTAHDNNLVGTLVPEEMIGTYEVLLMKVLPNATMPIHLHDYPRVYIVFEGPAKLGVGTETREIRGGQAIFLPPTWSTRPRWPGPKACATWSWSETRGYVSWAAGQRLNMRVNSSGETPCRFLNSLLK